VNHSPAQGPVLTRRLDWQRLPTGSFAGWTVLAAILAAGAQTAQAQEALRSSLAGEETAAARRSALQNQTGSLQLGLTSLLLSSSLALEWNDNVSYSDANQQQDFILRPLFSLAASRPITEQNGLFATLDIGYAKYFHYSQYDHLLIAPGTQLAFDAYVKDFHFDLHDDVAVTEQPVAQGTISNSGNYGMFSNLAGLGVDWDLNQLIASFGYDHQTAIATTSFYSYQNHSAENFVVRASLEPSDSLTAGPEASAGITTYDQHVLNDSRNYSVGGFATWDPTTLCHLDFRAGYTLFSFSSQPPQRPVPDSSNVYIDGTLKQRLNDVISVSVNGGRQTRLGVNSELLDFWYAHPGIDWHLFEKVNLNTHFVYESGSDSGNPLLVVNEDYTLLGGGVIAGYQLMQKLGLGLSYDYAVKDSNISNRNYHQHVVSLQIQYTF